jgi:hypothetical protein
LTYPYLVTPAEENLSVVVANAVQNVTYTSVTLVRLN